MWETSSYCWQICNTNRCTCFVFLLYHATNARCRQNRFCTKITLVSTRLKDTTIFRRFEAKYKLRNREWKHKERGERGHRRDRQREANRPKYKGERNLGTGVSDQGRSTNHSGGKKTEKTHNTYHTKTIFAVGLSLGPNNFGNNKSLLSFPWGHKNDYSD